MAAALSGWARYHKLQTLGHGAYGTVYLARDRAVPDDDDDAHVAVKCVPLADVGDREKQMAMGEVAILRQLDHKNVLRLLDCFIDEDSFLCSVTEFIDGGDMADFQKRVAEDSAGVVDALVIADLAEQMLEGLTYLHANHVLHRDIKPQNFYLTKAGVMKIGDFGVSKLLTASVPQAGTFVGTPFYMAPEVCLGEKYSYVADVWSVGVLLYELYVGKVPFTASNVLALIHQVTEGKYDTDALEQRPYGATGASTSLGDELQRDICNMVTSLVKACIVTDPFARPTASDLLHDFFRKSGGSGSSAIRWDDDGALEIEGHEDWSEEQVLEARQPSWLHNSEALSEIAISEPATARRASVSGGTPQGPQGTVTASPSPPTGLSAQSTSLGDVAHGSQKPSARASAHEGERMQSHVDPKELERLLREKAFLLHRKRLAQERQRRSEEESAKAQQAAQKAAEAAAQAEREAAAHREPVVGRIGSSRPPPEQQQPSAEGDAAATAAASPLDVARSSGNLRDSLRKVAEAIVAADPTRQACAAALLGTANVLEEDDEDDADAALAITILSSEKVVAVKGKRGMSYKKLLRKVRKALGLAVDEDLPGVLSYRDSDGDEIEVTGKRDWRHAVDDFVERSADSLVLRLSAAS